ELAQGCREVGLRGVELVLEDLVAACQRLVLSRQGADGGLVAGVVGVKHPDADRGDEKRRRQRDRPPAPLTRLDPRRPRQARRPGRGRRRVGLDRRLHWSVLGRRRYLLHLGRAHHGTAGCLDSQIWPGRGHTLYTWLI